MRELVEFQIGEDQSILVEVEELETDAIVPVARESGQLAVKAQKTFEQAIDNIQPMITVLKEKIDSLKEPADEVEVKFGVKLNGQVGAVLTSIGGEVTYEITLKWNRSEKKGE